MIDDELLKMKFGGLELIQENSHEESLMSFSGEISLSINAHENASLNKDQNKDE